MRRIIFVISAIAVVNSAAALWFFVEKEAARRNYQELERTLTLENSFLKRTLSEVSGERDQFKDKMAQLSDEMGRLKQAKLEIAARLNTAVQIQEDLQGKIAAFEGEKQIFQAQIRDQKERIAHLQGKVLAGSSDEFIDRKRVDSLKKELGRIKEERTELEQRLVTADQTIQKLQSQTQKVQLAGGTIELPPIVVGAGQAFPSSGMAVSSRTSGVPDGKILTVNEEHGFVIIGLGQKDGVQPGMKFKVLRGGQEVGNVEVIEARHNISAADVKEIRTAGFQADDQVLLSQR
ncbi:MAG: hypothetical protein HYS56_01720 [Candidatus Omnitrophica bacterium]|nr:hypothetical protein [Candidatus Omnitrophota bacterium]